MDYMSQVWTPVDQGSINKLEGVLRLYTSYTKGLETSNYWQRLEKMILLSVQRRHERYRIIYIWKIIQGMIPNFGIIWDHTVRRGRMITISKVNSKIPKIALTLRDQSLSVHGGKLYNLLSREIRDSFLKDIPDQPLCTGLYPAPISSSTNRNSNSLIDWIKYLNMRGRQKMRMEDYDSLT